MGSIAIPVNLYILVLEETYVFDERSIFEDRLEHHREVVSGVVLAGVHQFLDFIVVSQL